MTGQDQLVEKTRAAGAALPPMDASPDAGGSLAEWPPLPEPATA